MKAFKKAKTVAAKQAVTNGKAKVPDAVKAIAAKATEAADKSEQKKTQALVPHLKTGALSKDLGPVVVASLAKSYQTEIEAKAALVQVEGKRYETLSQMVLGIVKAAKADTGINLAVAFADDKAAKQYLNDQACVALGIKEVVTVGKDDKTVQRCTWAKGVASYFPARGDDKDAEETKRKATFRSNFIHTLAKCLKTAAGIVESDTKAEMDKKAGTLRLTGPAVKKQFGQPSVLLNEKQNIEANGKDVKLTERPSFTAIAAKAAEAHGKIVHRGTNTRGTVIESDPGKSVQSICKSLVQAIGKLEKEPDKATQEALEGVQTAIEDYLA
jgi:hypothetical protein